MRLAAILWLVPGLLCGLLTLGILGGGGYFAYRSHTKVDELTTSLEKDKIELDKFEKGRVIAPDAWRNLDKKVRTEEADLANTERERLIALILTATCVIPGLMALAFLMMAAVKFMQKPKKPAAEEEEEVEEEEVEVTEVTPEKTSIKAKPKPKE